MKPDGLARVSREACPPAAANLTCLALLYRYRAHDMNMSSTFECSRNDVIANVGVLLAAAGVWWWDSAWPDIAVGLTIAALFLRSQSASSGRRGRSSMPRAQPLTAPASR